VALIIDICSNRLWHIKHKHFHHSISISISIRAEQSRAEQSRAEQSRAEQSSSSATCHTQPRAAYLAIQYRACNSNSVDCMNNRCLLFCFVWSRAEQCKRGTQQAARRCRRHFEGRQKLDTTSNPNAGIQYIREMVAYDFYLPPQNCPFLLIVNHKITTHNPTSFRRESPHLK
jgi:hypothetical protein